MSDTRFSIQHREDGSWRIEDRDFVFPELDVAWQLQRMGLSESERVVRLMNELDGRLRMKAGSSQVEEAAVVAS